MVVYLNGEFIDADTPAAAALRPGAPDFPGVYTTLRAVRGVAADLPRHLTRLRRHAAEMGLPDQLAPGDLPGIIEQLAEAGGLLGTDARLRLVLARHRPEGDFLAALEPMPDGLAQALRDGAAVVTLGPEFARTRSPHLKNLDMAPSLAALQQAQREGASEAFIHDAFGRLTEGAISNIFLFADGLWRTPPADGRILAGLTRQRILEMVPGSREHVLTRDDLAAAREAFFCNSLRGIVPVVRVDGRAVGDGRPGPALAAVREILTPP